MCQALALFLIVCYTRLMSTYVTKALYLGRPEQAEALLKQIDEARGMKTFAQFVIEAIKEKLASQK